MCRRSALCPVEPTAGSEPAAASEADFRRLREGAFFDPSFGPALARRRPRPPPRGPRPAFSMRAPCSRWRRCSSCHCCAVSTARMRRLISETDLVMSARALVRRSIASEPRRWSTVSSLKTASRSPSAFCTSSRTSSIRPRYSWTTERISVRWASVRSSPLTMGLSHQGKKPLRGPGPPPWASDRREPPESGTEADTSIAGWSLVAGLLPGSGRIERSLPETEREWERLPWAPHPAPSNTRR